jgi:hypothetical protein
MARATPAQICSGTLAVVVVTVAALAFSGTNSVPAISVLVVGILLLATVATALAVTRPRSHGRRTARRALEPARMPAGEEYAARVPAPRGGAPLVSETARH